MVVDMTCVCCAALGCFDGGELSDREVLVASIGGIVWGTASCGYRRAGEQSSLRGNNIASRR
jgi:hypothetical protein